MLSFSQSFFNSFPLFFLGFNSASSKSFSFFTNLNFLSILIISFSLLLFLLFSFFLFLFNTNTIEFQYRFDFLGFTSGFDGINTSFLFLLSFFFPILLIISLRDCFFFSKEIKHPAPINNDSFFSLLLLFPLFFFLFLLFLIQDIFFFYLSFEWLVFPLFFLILKFGSNYPFFLSRYDASYRLLLYTIFGGLFLFFSFLFLFFSFGSSNSELLSFFLSSSSILSLPFSSDSSPLDFSFSIIWALLLFSFLIKVPTFPFYTWLPQAHSEAPTFGSILLAAIILKLSSYGILKFNLFLFPLSSTISLPSFDFSIDNSFFNFSIEDSLIDSIFPFFSVLLLFSLLFSSFTPLRGLSDIKKIIAYSSIVHMNFSLFGLFSFDFSGLLGGSLLIFSHALTSSALFYLIGSLYSLYHSRLLSYYQGLSHLLPLFSSFFFLFSLSNISLPFTFSFLPEFLLLSSSLLFNPFFTFFLLLSLLISSSFFFYFTCKLLFGSLSPYLTSSFASNKGYFDLTKLDFFILFPFLFFTFFFAFFPSSIISFLSLSLLLF